MNFFEKQEQRLSKQKQYAWAELKEVPKEKGLYVIIQKDENEICYIGESKNLHDRLYNHHRTGNHSSFRKNLAKKFNESLQTEFLTKCVVTCLPMLYGRKELEEYLVEKYKPVFNIL